MNDIPFFIFKFIFLFCMIFGKRFKNPTVQTAFGYIATFCFGAEVMFILQLFFI